VDRRRLQPHHDQSFYSAGQEDATRSAPFTVDTDQPPVLLGANHVARAGEFCAARIDGMDVGHDRLRDQHLSDAEVRGRPGWYLGRRWGSLLALQNRELPGLRHTGVHQPDLVREEVARRPR
jgi:hypothetical protein